MLHVVERNKASLYSVERGQYSTCWKFNITWYTVENLTLNECTPIIAIHGSGEGNNFFFFPKLFSKRTEGSVKNPLNWFSRVSFERLRVSESCCNLIMYKVLHSITIHIQKRYLICRCYLTGPGSCTTNQSIYGHILPQAWPLAVTCVTQSYWTQQWQYVVVEHKTAL